MTTSFSKTLIKSCMRSLKTSSSYLRFASTFNAAVLKKPSDALLIEEQSSQKLKKDEVRIQVHYCSVNSVDCTSFRNPDKEVPFVPGYELSGEVIEIGKAIKPEQAILSEKVAALSLEKFGGFAKECVVNIKDVFRVPSNVAVKDAAVLICGHSTAYYAFSNIKTPKEGEQIIVTAGPAGLGLAAVDVAANVFKAKVIGVTDTEDRSELVRTCGAFQTLRYHPKLKKDILGMTSKKGVGIIYDAVGENMIEAIGDCLDLAGNMFHAAPLGSKSIPVPPYNTSLTMVSLHALRNQNLELYQSTVNETLELANQGMISGHVSAVYSLQNINEAIKYIEDRKCTGKVVIQIME